MLDETNTKIEINQGTNDLSLDTEPIEEVSPPHKVKTDSKRSLRKSLESEELSNAFEEAQIASEYATQLEMMKTLLPVCDREKRGIEIPANLKKQERNVWLILTSLAYLTGVSVTEYETEISYVTKKDSDRFLDGLLIGTMDSKPTRLDRNKTLNELGRAIAFSLKVRGELHKLNKSEWLIRNHWFFGNNPTETMNKVPVPFGSKVKLIDIWENKNFGDAMYSVFIYLFEELGLNQFSDVDYRSSILKYTLRFEDIIQKFYQPIRSTKRGKTTISGYRKGKKPNPSPLLTKGEYQLVLRVADPMWKDLDTYKSEWLNILLAESKASNTIDELRKLYKSRYEFLQKFGAMTTKRLQEIRIIENNVNLKKVDVTPDMLTRLLKNRASPANSFCREVRKMFKTNLWAIDEFEINNELEEKQFDQFIAKEIVLSYVEDGYFKLKDESQQAVEPIQIEKKLLEALKTIQVLFKRLRELSNRLNQFRGVSELKLLERKLVALVFITPHVSEGIKKMSEFTMKDIDFILSRYYHVETTALSLNNFIQELNVQIDYIDKCRALDWKTNNEVLFELRDSILKAWILCDKNQSFLKHVK